MASGGKSRRAEQTAKAAAPARQSRHHRGGVLGLDQEDTVRVLLWGTTLLVVLLTAFLIVFGYYWTTIKPRGRTVLQVDDIRISYSDMKRRMAYEYYSQPNLQNTRSLQLVPLLAYENLLRELTLVSRARTEMGVDYTQEEFDAAMRREVGVSTEASDEEFGQRFRTRLAESRLKEPEFRRIVEAGLLEQKVKEKILADAGESVPQAKVEAIVVNTREEAEAAITRINAGEEWGVVARELSKEPDVQDTGGAKDYQFQGGHPNAYDDFAFTAEIGQVSEPLAETPDSDASRYWIVRVVDRREQPLREDQRDGYQNQEFRRIIQETQSRMTIIDKWSDDFEAQADALAPLARDAQRREQERQNIPTPVIPTVAPTTPGAETPAAGTPAAQTPAAAVTPPPPVATP